MTNIPVDEPQRDSASAQTPVGPTGIGGWLIFFMFGLGLALLMNLTQLATVGEAFSAEAREVGAAVPAFWPLTIFEVLGHLVLIAGCAAGLWLILRKDPRAPRFHRAFLAFVVIYGVIDLMGSYLVYPRILDLIEAAGASSAEAEQAQREAYTSALRMIAYGLFWGLYWRKSKRVANTFGFPSNAASAPSGV